MKKLTYRFVPAMILLFVHCSWETPNITIGNPYFPDLYKDMVNNPENQYDKTIIEVELVDSFYQCTGAPGETFYYYKLSESQTGGIPISNGSYFTTTIDDTINEKSELIYSCTVWDSLTKTNCAILPIKNDDGSITYSTHSNPCPNANSGRFDVIMNSKLGVLFSSKSCYSGMNGNSSNTVLLKHNDKEINVGLLLNEYYSKRAFYYRPPHKDADKR